MAWENCCQVELHIDADGLPSGHHSAWPCSAATNGRGQSELQRSGAKIGRGAAVGRCAYVVVLHDRDVVGGEDGTRRVVHQLVRPLHRRRLGVTKAPCPLAFAVELDNVDFDIRPELGVGDLEVG